MVTATVTILCSVLCSEINTLHRSHFRKTVLPAAEHQLDLLPPELTTALIRLLLNFEPAFSS